LTPYATIILFDIQKTLYAHSSGVDQIDCLLIVFDRGSDVLGVVIEITLILINERTNQEISGIQYELPNWIVQRDETYIHRIVQN
jgi:hypothetical protein